MKIDECGDISTFELETMREICDKNLFAKKIYKSNIRLDSEIEKHIKLLLLNKK